MRTRIKSTIICFILFIFSISFLPLKVKATEQETEKKSIIFLLDASGSMVDNDPNRLAIDSIAQLIYSLPSNYYIGFVAYNNELVANQKPIESDERSSIMKVAENVKYVGYSNAGEGLLQAVKLLEEENTKEKTIIILSDGEILMRNEEETKESKIIFQEAVEQAKNMGAKIHVIGLGEEMEDIENTIFSASESTDGERYYVPYAVEIQKVIDTILDKKLKIKRNTAAILEVGEITQEVKINLPSSYADKVRILLTSGAEIKNLKTDFTAESAKQFHGERYSLIEMKKPTNVQVNLSFQGKTGNQVKVDVITEYQLSPKIEVEYIDREPEDSSASHYERTAKLTATFYDAVNSNIQLLTEDIFNYIDIPMMVNGEQKIVSLLNGKLEWEYPVIEDIELEIDFDYFNLPTNILSGDSMKKSLEGPSLLPPPPLPEPDYTPIYIAVGIGGIFFIGVIGFIVWKIRHKPIALPEPEDMPPPPSKFSYTGKVNIYITKTASEYDIPPLSFNLFRLSPNRVISLAEMLEECNVEERLEGASKIFFKSGANKNLVLTNNSDCTIMKNREILMKNRSYSLALDSKIDITFEDEISELTLQYKDLKPSEMKR